MSTQKEQSSALALANWLDAASVAIMQARKFADQNEVQLGWYILRDLKATKLAGLTDLAWSVHKHGSSCSKELIWFIEELERYCSSANVGSEPQSQTTPDFNHS